MAAGTTNPVLVEVTRGTLVESRHRGAAVVMCADGAVEAAWGDVARDVLPRSAVKPLQVLPLIESGAADAFDVSDAEIALACASHNGERRHVDAASAWLGRLGLSGRDLECGAHAPMRATSADDMVRHGDTPTALHNNCSGKHSGMLTQALHMGEPTKGYVSIDHPVQQRVRAALSEMMETKLYENASGIDGCSIPTFAAPLDRLAHAMARFADPAGLGRERAAAIARVHRALRNHPFMIAGAGRLDTALIEATDGAVLAKTGAEGVYAAAVPARGLGIALKIDDGATRASEVALGAILRYLGALDDRVARRLTAFIDPGLTNWRGRAVGSVRASADWLG